MYMYCTMTQTPQKELEGGCINLKPWGWKRGIQSDLRVALRGRYSTVDEGRSHWNRLSSNHHSYWRWLLSRTSYSNGSFNWQDLSRQCYAIQFYPLTICTQYCKIFLHAITFLEMYIINSYNAHIATT